MGVTSMKRFVAFLLMISLAFYSMGCGSGGTDTATEGMTDDAPPGDASVPVPDAAPDDAASNPPASDAGTP
jgi:hypothetical protein